MDRGLVKTPPRKSRDLEFLAKKLWFAKFSRGGFLVIQTINSRHYDNINVEVFKSSKVKRGVNFGDIRKMRGPFAPQDLTLVSHWYMYTSYEMLSWIFHLLITTRSSQVEPFLVQPLCKKDKKLLRAPLCGCPSSNEQWQPRLSTTSSQEPWCGRALPQSDQHLRTFDPKTSSETMISPFSSWDRTVRDVFHTQIYLIS